MARHLPPVDVGTEPVLLVGQEGQTYGSFVIHHTGPGPIHLGDHDVTPADGPPVPANTWTPLHLVRGSLYAVTSGPKKARPITVTILDLQG